MKLGNFLIVSAMIIAIFPSGCGKTRKADGESEKAPETRYTILKEERARDSMNASLLAKPGITELEIIEALKEQDAAYKRFYPNAIIWMFATREQYEADAGLWLGMIIRREDGSPWEMNIDREQLQTLREGPSEKFGMSEEQRKKIYWTMANDEDNAMIEAIKAYPYLDDAQPGWSVDLAAEQLKRQGKQRRTLSGKCHDEAPKKYNLTREQLDQINVEGGKKKWPIPSPSRLKEVMETTKVSAEEAHVVIDVCKVEGILVDGTGAVVFIAHNRNFEPVKTGAQICGGEVVGIYAPKESDGVTPTNNILFYDYRVKMRFADGERILKNGEYISGAPQSAPKKPERPASEAVTAGVAPNTSSSVGNDYYRKLSDDIFSEYERASTSDSNFEEEAALQGYKDVLPKAKDAYSTTNLADKGRLRQIIDQSERREREISKYLEAVAAVRAQITTPEALSKWLRKNVHYESDRYGDDYWQAPYETLARKAGDCEDYAFLVQALLNEIGIRSRVIMVSYMKGSERKGHALCVFQRDGAYWYFSGSNLNKPSASSIEQLMDQAYPGWLAIVELDLKTKGRMDIARK
jgi:hypothetical protein